MDLPQLGARSARGDGTHVANDCCAGSSIAAGTGHASRVGDDIKDQTFDFQWYYSEDQANARAPNLELGPASDCQHYNDSQRDDPAENAPSEVVDDDGCRGIFESGPARFYSINPLKSALVRLEASCSETDFDDPLGSVDNAQLAEMVGVEKWDVDTTVMEFLASVLALSDPRESLLAQCGLRLHLRDVKLEEPVLSSDAATDMLRLRQRNIVRLTPRGIKPFPSDKRHDKDLQWSTKSLRLPADMEKLLAAEKMTVNGETRSLLKKVFEDMNGDIMQSMSGKSQYNSFLRPMTSPLLPLSPLYSPGSLPSAAALLHFTSTPEDPLVRESRDLDTQMMEFEDIEDTFADGSHVNIYSPTEAVAKGSSSPLRRKFDTISELKVSSPLLPVEPPVKKSKHVSFAEELRNLVPQRDSDDVSTDPLVAADIALAAISAMVEPLAQSALEQASNEHLVELDTTARLAVPSIEDVVPEEPWSTYHGKHHSLLELTKAEIPKTDTRWSGVSSLERLLPWSPFPAHLGKPKSEGDFDDGSLARYLSELDIEDDVDVQQLMWKPDGLRILDFDDEEELTVSDYKHGNAERYCNNSPHEAQIVNMASHNLTNSLDFPSSQPPRELRRRTSEAIAAVVSTAEFKPCPRDSRAIVPKIGEPEVNSMLALLEKRRVQLQLEKATLDANLVSSTQRNIHAEAEQVVAGEKLEAPARHGNLSAFMTIQGVRGTPQREVPKARQAEAKVDSTISVPIPTPTRPPLQIPVPRITVSKSTLPIVVSSAVMANRQLIRKLRQQLPTLNAIERESTIPNEKQIGGSSTAREADLTLSPSTGLIFITLQKLKQRPLPGQEASFVGIGEQFARVAPRYERLIVLLSEGGHSMSEVQTHIRTLDERDSIAIADFIGFFSRLDTDVQVSYVPGGERELVKWIAAAVTRWAPCIESFNLLDEETVWENFLRKAGMNAFAAQVVLDRLKRPASHLDESMMLCSSGFERYGLAALVRMDVYQRIQLFGPALGGERMLKRVSMAIDGSW